MRNLFSVGLRRRLQYDLFPIIIWQKMIIWQLNRGRPTWKSWIIRLASNLNWHSFLRQNFDIRLPALDFHLFSSEIQNWLQIFCTTTSMRTMWNGELGLLQVRSDSWKSHISQLNKKFGKLKGFIQYKVTLFCGDSGGGEVSRTPRD